MDSAAAAIRQFLEDGFQLKLKRGTERMTEQLAFRELEQLAGDRTEYASQRIDQAFQKNWDAKGPAIEAHTKVLASGAAVAPHLVAYPDVAKRLHKFLYWLDWRVMRLDKGMEDWPDLAIDLNQLLVSAEAARDPIAAGMEEQPRSISTKAKNVNARMLEGIQQDAERIGWNSTQWATYLSCTTAAVTTQPTWKDLEMRREREKAERAQDRRRRTKPQRHS